MSGVVALVVIVAIAFGALVLLRLPRRLWPLVGTALSLGAAGYVRQGWPGLPAVPGRPTIHPVAIDPAAIALREVLMGRFTADTAYLTASDAMLRSGDRHAAAAVVIGGIRAIPRSYILWTQLGTNLAILDDDRMSPPAKLAFHHAMHLAPEHPAPSYYAGLAHIRAGDLPTARPLLARAVRLSRAGTGYRRDIEHQLTLLDRAIAARMPAR